MRNDRPLCKFPSNGKPNFAGGCLGLSGVLVVGFRMWTEGLRLSGDRLSWVEAWVKMTEDGWRWIKVGERFDKTLRGGI